jgi:hypothetical protein
MSGQEQESIQIPLEWRDLSPEGVLKLRRELAIRFPSLRIFGSEGLGVAEKWVQRLELGEIKAVLGYKKGKVIIPEISTLPFSCDRLHVRVAKGMLDIDHVSVKRFGGLSEKDAADLGYVNLQEMRFVIWRHFGEVGSSEVVTITRVAGFKIHWENGVVRHSKD